MESFHTLPPVMQKVDQSFYALWTRGFDPCYGIGGAILWLSAEAASMQQQHGASVRSQPCFMDFEASLLGALASGVRPVFEIHES